MRTALIVDDHPFIRASVKLLLKQERFGVVGEAEDGVQGALLVREFKPDVVILDISMPGLDGLEVITRIKDSAAKARIVILTSQPPEYFSLRCMKLGAMGFVSKNNDLEELRKAVRAVISGFTYFPEVVFSSVRRSDCTTSEAQCIAMLSDRELTILQQLARGHSNKDIAQMMLLSSKTVSTYKIRLIEKLRVKSLVELADLAKRNLLV